MGVYVVVDLIDTIRMYVIAHLVPSVPAPGLIISYGRISISPASTG